MDGKNTQLQYQKKKLNKQKTIPNKALLFGATIRKTIMASGHQISPQMLRT